MIYNKVVSHLPSLCKSNNPYLTIGQSATTHAAMQSKLIPMHTLKNMLVMDILSYTISVVSQDSFVKVLEKESTMLCKSFKNFTMEKKYAKWYNFACSRGNCT